MVLPVKPVMLYNTPINTSIGLTNRTYNTSISINISMSNSITLLRRVGGIVLVSVSIH